MAYKITDKCVACGSCIDECPVGAISEGRFWDSDLKFFQMQLAWSAALDSARPAAIIYSSQPVAQP